MFYTKLIMEVNFTARWMDKVFCLHYMKQEDTRIEKEKAIQFFKAEIRLVLKNGVYFLME